MTASSDNRFPKLRLIDATATTQDGEPAILLRDPLQLSGNYMVLPQFFGPALMMMDGSHDVNSIRTRLVVQYGIPMPRDLLDHLVSVLDENFMLENAQSDAAHERVLAEYRSAPFRPAMMAGQSYPAQPHRLRAMFDGYLSQVDGTAQPAEGRGVASPHIDYARGGPVYAAVWQQARQMVRAADLVVLLGTDHYGTGEDRLTLTRQHYATPYGVLPTDTAIVDALAAAIDPEAAFNGELRNRGEHSLELVATWLHHMRGGEPVATVPVLTGSFGDFILGQAEPAVDATLNAFLDTLRQHMDGRRALVVASGDLAHVGPAFGGAPLDQAARDWITAADEALMAHMVAGDAEGFFAAVKGVRDRNNVCGVAPFYLMMRLLRDAEGSVAAYDQCPADPQDTSLVSVCGMVFG